MNALSNFSQFALTRSEMKAVSGGQCYYNSAGTPTTCSSLADCKELVNLGWGTNYCCSSCSTASWCDGPNGAGSRCPQ